MSRVTCHMSVSLDGFVAGPDQSMAEPLGRGGRELHWWHLRPEGEVENRFATQIVADKGAFVMGRNMFGPVRGPWGESDWTGWWGDEPPYHAPVFVLTHHDHAPIELRGTTFHFVTGGFDVALAAAREAAGERDVDVAGGAETVRQALRAGVVDELVLDLVPITLGAGESIFDGVPDLAFTVAEVATSPRATFLRYRRA